MPTTTKGDKLTCLRCDYGSDRPWLQKFDWPPASCPKCHSYHWQEPRKQPRKDG